MNEAMIDLATIPTDALIDELKARRVKLREEMLAIDSALDGQPVTCTNQARRLAVNAAALWEVDMDMIFLRTRQGNIPEARQAVALILRTRHQFTFQEIGDVLGGLDHGTIIHACKQMQTRLKTDEELAKRVTRLLEMTYAS